MKQIYHIYNINLSDTVMMDGTYEGQDLLRWAVGLQQQLRLRLFVLKEEVAL